ncbi:MAG TPA: NADP-dependent oxidoreductase [Anaerolineae bacterium]|nr:NADP-dependent oxidoreductase [Anaerolineae bacterium]
MSELNQQILLAHRPTGAPQTSDFRWVETAVPEIGDGQFLVRSHYLSLDPYMRGRMSEAKSYAKPVELGEVMIGGAVGQVVTSRHPKFKAGDMVVGNFGWQLYAVSDGAGVRKITDRNLPLSAYLGVVGMPGVTAYVGLLDIGQPKSGETVVVSAAGGAVGGVVGQIARIHGCRTVGIAGGPEKCRYVVEELGFDACVDYKTGRLWEDVKEATPQGIDVYFDNVGGEILDTILRRMNPFGRIPLCGVISQYNATQPYGVKNTRSLLINRIKLQGFLIFDHSARWPVVIKELAQWVSEGKIKYRETVAEGLRSAPEAFIGMLAGKNLGKQLVKLI